MTYVVGHVPSGEMSCAVPSFPTIVALCVIDSHMFPIASCLSRAFFDVPTSHFTCTACLTDEKIS